MADKNHPFATKLLHHHGFITRSDVTSQFIGHDRHVDIGRADIFASRMGRAVSIEVKYGKMSWRHAPKWDSKAKKWRSGWHYKQREWGAMSMESPFCTPYYVFLTMGENPASWNPEKYNPRKSWLIPFIALWKAVHAIEQADMLSMPYKVKKGIRRVYQDNQWSASDLFSEYELQWNKQDSLIRPEWFFDTAGKPYGGFWTVPEDHEFYKRFIAVNSDYNQPECLDLTEVKNAIRESIPSTTKNTKRPAKAKRSRGRSSRRQGKTWDKHGKRVSRSSSAT